MGAGGRSQHTAAALGQPHTDGATGRSQPQGDSRRALGKPSGHAGQPSSRAQEQIFLPILLQTSRHPRLSLKTPSTATSSQVTPKAESRLPLPFPFTTQFFPSRAQVKVLRLLYPEHKVSPCAGEDALSPSPSCEPRGPASSPQPCSGPDRPGRAQKSLGCCPGPLLHPPPDTGLCYLQPTHPCEPVKGRRHNSRY